MVFNQLVEHNHFQAVLVSKNTNTLNIIHFIEARLIIFFIHLKVNYIATDRKLKGYTLHGISETLRKFSSNEFDEW